MGGGCLVFLRDPLEEEDENEDEALRVCALFRCVVRGRWMGRDVEPFEEEEEERAFFCWVTRGLLCDGGGGGGREEGVGGGGLESLELFELYTRPTESAGVKARPTGVGSRRTLFLFGVT